MNVKQPQVIADPSIKLTALGHESICRLLVSTLTIIINYIRGVQNPMKMSDIGFLKTEPTSKFKN